jgi:hypothetical protein
VQARAEVPKVRLQTRFEDGDITRVRFADMRPFDAHEFLIYVAWIYARRKKSPESALVLEMTKHDIPVLVDIEEIVAEVETWSGVWFCTNIHEAYEQLLLCGRVRLQEAGREAFERSWSWPPGACATGRGPGSSSWTRSTSSCRRSATRWRAGPSSRTSTTRASPRSSWPTGSAPRS